VQDNGAHIFFCGLKGMMPGIQDMLQRVAKVSASPCSRSTLCSYNSPFGWSCTWHAGGLLRLWKSSR